MAKKSKEKPVTFFVKDKNPVFFLEKTGTVEKRMVVNDKIILIIV